MPVGKPWGIGVLVFNNIGVSIRLVRVRCCRSSVPRIVLTFMPF